MDNNTNFFKKPTGRSLAVNQEITPTVGKRNPLLSKSCEDLLNYRILQEEYSSRLYLSMSLWLNNTGYKNAGSLWKKYSEEEQNHADWAKTYLLSMGVQPTTPALDAPGDTYEGLPQIIRLSFAHEIAVTKQCKELADAAVGEKDHMLYTLAHKYLSEQIEEHDKMQNLLDQLTAFGEDKIALRLLDNSLA